MAGSGSNMIVANDLFVPDALILRPSQNPPAEALLVMEGLEPPDRWPMEPLFPLGVLAPMLGAAAAILEGVVQSLDKRLVTGWAYANHGQAKPLVDMVRQEAVWTESAWLHDRLAERGRRT